MKKKLKLLLFVISLFVCICVLRSPQICYVNAQYVKIENEKIKEIKTTNMQEEVEKETVIIPEITLNNTEMTMYVGEIKILKATIVGENNIVTYYSENENIATVQQTGHIEAKHSGVTNIIVKANGIQKSCKVIVKFPSKVINEDTCTRGITLKKENFNMPKQEDFGEWINYANSLYTAIINKENFFFEFDFKNKEDALSFDNLVELKILPQGVCLYQSYCTGYDKLEDGTFKEYHRMRYDKSWINRKNVDIYIAENMVYNACISAGLENGISETEAVKKIITWLANHMTYQLNNGDEYIGFTTGKGQCSTYAKMFFEMCGVAGIECQYIEGNANGPHAWNYIKADGTNYYVDVTWYDSTKNSKYMMSENLWSSHKIK